MTTNQPDLSIDGLMAELMALAQISEAEPPVVTRVVFGEADMRARAYVKGLCTEAGLTVREDAVGNTFARWEGSDPTLAPVGTGSHIDAIPNAGLYDGCVGVLGRPGSDSRSQEARLQAAPLHRARDFYCRGAHALRHRLPGQPHDGQRAHPEAGARSARQGRPRAGRVARASRIHRFARIRRGAQRPLPQVCRVAYRAGAVPRAGRTRCGPGDAHCCAGQPAHRD